MEITTPRQRELLRIVKSWREREGISPSLDEIAEIMDCYKNSVKEKVASLVEKGLLSKNLGVCRSVRLTAAGEALLQHFSVFRQE